MDESRFWETFTLLAAGIPSTVQLTLGALLIGAVGGLPVMMMRRSELVLPRLIATVYIEIVRGVPPLVWIFIAFFGLPRLGMGGLSPAISATVALGIVSTAYLAEIYRAGVDSVPRGQWESSEALGMGRTDLFRRIIVPQAVPLVLPPAGTFAVGMIKETALASIIGVTDITFRAYIETQRTYEGLYIFLIAALVYLIICVPAAALTRRVDTVFNRRRQEAWA